MSGFITLTALVDGHSIAAQREAVRVIEDEVVGDKNATRVTLTDGTQFVVRETLLQILSLLKTEKKR
jgi:hypothetical protein